MPPDEIGKAPAEAEATPDPNTATTPATGVNGCTTYCTAVEPQGNSDQIGAEDQLRSEFVTNLVQLTGVVVWTAPPVEGRGEFRRPTGWQTLTPGENDARLGGFRPGGVLCLNTGGMVAVIDDPRGKGMDLRRVAVRGSALNIVLQQLVNTAWVSDEVRMKIAGLMVGGQSCPPRSDVGGAADEG